MDLYVAGYIAGFTDGEGCFQIKQYCDGARFGCAYRIQLRADDEAILTRFRSELAAVGNIYSVPAKRTSNPAVEWQVESKSGCAVIQEFFREYPLLGKKGLDFVIWDKAVTQWINHRRGDDWTELEVLYHELQDCRAYA
jgi:hypothetical protein